jgi:hypothetical protein
MRGQITQAKGWRFLTRPEIYQEDEVNALDGRSRAYQLAIL